MPAPDRLVDSRRVAHALMDFARFLQSGQWRDIDDDDVQIVGERGPPPRAPPVEVITVEDSASQLPPVSPPAAPPTETQVVDNIPYEQRADVNVPPTNTQIVDNIPYEHRSDITTGKKKKPAPKKRKPKTQQEQDAPEPDAVVDEIVKEQEAYLRPSQDDKPYVLRPDVQSALAVRARMDKAKEKSNIDRKRREKRSLAVMGLVDDPHPTLKQKALEKLKVHQRKLGAQRGAASRRGEGHLPDTEEERAERFKRVAESAEESIVRGVDDWLGPDTDTQKSCVRRVAHRVEQRAPAIAAKAAAQREAMIEAMEADNAMRHLEERETLEIDPDWVPHLRPRRQPPAYRGGGSYADVERYAAQRLRAGTAIGVPKVGVW